MDTSPHEKKLEDRALKTRYLRAISESQYLFFLQDNEKTRLIKDKEFFLEAKFEQLVRNEDQKSHDQAEAYEPFCDWVMHTSKKALRAKIIAGARRVPEGHKSNAK